MLTEPGEYWADLGLYWEYSYSTLSGTPDDTLFGPLIQKDIGHTTHTLNLFLGKEIGPNQDVPGLDFSYAWQSRWNVFQLASPAVEIYGDAGRTSPFAKFQNQQLIAGPVVVGSVALGNSRQAEVRGRLPVRCYPRHGERHGALAPRVGDAFLKRLPEAGL